MTITVQPVSFASIGLMQLPTLGQAETPVRGLAWVAVAAAIALLARAWWNLALEVFGSRMSTVAFALLVAFVAWVWIWFAVVVVKCEGSLPACGAWRPMVDVGALTMWATFAWVVWWRTERWIFSALLLVGSVLTRLPIYVKDLPPSTRPFGNPLTFQAACAMASSGFVTTMMMQFGECFTICSTTAFTTS